MAVMRRGIRQEIRRLTYKMGRLEANWSTGWRTFVWIGSTMGFLGTLACRDISSSLPSGIADPNTSRTPAGALQMYTAAVYTFQAAAHNGGSTGFPNPGAFVSYVLASGILTDEMRAGNLGGGDLSYLLSNAVGISDSLDARLSSELENPYNDLQNVRGAALQAIGALTVYNPTVSSALRGHLYALEGYAELLLADSYCSGVPLSTIDFNADFTYRAGSTTQEVYGHALALFDTAITLSADSVRILNFARIGKGRVLLDLGRYAEAAQAVADVPDTYQYSFFVDWSAGSTAAANSIFGRGLEGNGSTVGDAEGGTGLLYLSSGDARSFSVVYMNNTFGVPQYAPMKYGATKPALAPVVVASGVEARLIEAEAALQAGDVSTWLTILNTLRTNGMVVRTYTRLCRNGIRVGTTTTQNGSPCPAGMVDTTWGLGAGSAFIPGAVMADTAPICPTATGVGAVCSDTIWYKGLKTLTDPGVGPLPTGKSAKDVRVDLLFKERAYWLFLTGQRQGDLRRLVREYGRDPETVYPTGPYPMSGRLPVYGSSVTADIPQTEFRNPKFTGCLSRGA